VVPSANRYEVASPGDPTTQSPPFHPRLALPAYVKYMGRSATTGLSDSISSEHWYCPPSSELTSKVARDLAPTARPLFTISPFSSVWKRNVRRAASLPGLSTHTYSLKPSPV
jgi:hypothetical protein